MICLPRVNTGNLAWVKACTSFQNRRDEEFLRCDVILDLQQVGLAADLAVFDVVLPPTCGFVNRGDIPLAAAGTLKASFHERNYLSHRLGTRANMRVSPAQLVQILVTGADAVKRHGGLVMFHDVVLDTRLPGLRKDPLPIDDAASD